MTLLQVSPLLAVTYAWVNCRKPSSSVENVTTIGYLSTVVPHTALL